MILTYIALLLISSRLFATISDLAASEIMPTIPDALLFSQTVMAPLPPLAELLSLTIKEDDKSITITRNDHKIFFFIDDTTALANGKEISLKMAPFIHTGICYVPLEELVITLGGNYSLLKNASVIRVDMPGQNSLNLPVRTEAADRKWFRDDHTALYAIFLNGQGLRRLTFNESDDSAPLFSPNGKMMLYKRDNGMFIRDINNSDGNYIFRTYASSQRNYQISAFSPNGNEIPFRSRRTN